MRPNPIALPTVKIKGIDLAKGRIDIKNIDAFDGSPVLDLKAYMPFFARDEDQKTPSWTAGWPQWMPDEGETFCQPMEDSIGKFVLNQKSSPGEEQFASHIKQKEIII